MIGSNCTAGKAERGSSSGHVDSKVALLMEHQLDKQEIRSEAVWPRDKRQSGRRVAMGRIVSIHGGGEVEEVKAVA